MILDFSNIKEDDEDWSENENNDSNLEETKIIDFQYIKMNIVDLIINKDLNNNNKVIAKSNSVPNLSNTRKQLKNLFQKDNNNYQIKNGIKYNNLNNY